MFAAHQWVEDILYFEGPLLSLLKVSTSKDFFYYWCGTFNRQNRWLAFEVSREQIDAYRVGDSSLADIVNSRDHVYLVFIDAQQHVKSAWEYPVAELPEKCMPPEDSYFDSELSLDAGETLLERSANYEIEVDGEWYADDMIKIPRTFQQLYAFLYTMRNLGKPSVRSNASNIFSRYPWRGGYSRVNFYQDLRRVMPSMHEMKVRSLAMASAGAFKFELLVDAAEDVRASLEASNRHAAILAETEKSVASLFRQHKLSKLRGNAPELSVDRKVLASLRRHVDTLGHALGLGEHLEEIRRLAKNDLVAVKILLSFHRRVQKLSKFQAGKMIRLA